MTRQGLELTEMGGAAAAAAIREGLITSEELVAACLARIDALEPRIQAWAFIDSDLALAQARAADQRRREGEPIGPLHGVPVGIKDIFDTADMPTENGTVLHAGRQPEADAAAVAQLRAAGAVILGKTVTTELAVYAPGKTRNPLDPDRTPGGSSSGSAAAVAAGMVPLAIGSQTNGSVIRPAAYCGVWGYKPTHGLISRRGVLHQSYLLDHVGVFGRSAEDVALLAEAMMSYDPDDRDMRPRARPALSRTTAEEPPVPPRIAFVRTPVWDQLDASAAAAITRFARSLGEHVHDVDLPPVFDRAVDAHRVIHESDLAVSFAPEYERGREKLSARLREMIENGQRHSAVDYIRATECAMTLSKALAEIFVHYDAILTPATTGEAPIGLQSTGSPTFCTIWTLLGVPTVTAPLLRGPAGMPLGVQLVGARGDDARLLRLARWLAHKAGPAAAH